VVILSDWAWQEYFQADLSVIGQQVRLSGEGYTVIGVMPRNVDFPRGAALWMPQYENVRRDSDYLQAVGRLKPGYSLEQLRAELDALFARLASEHSGFYSPTQQSVVTSLPDYWTGTSRPQLLLSLGAALLLLAAACVTAVNLFGSRMLARKHEFATRVALGASPWRIARQLICECSLVATVACLGGLALAQGLIEVFRIWAPTSIPRAEQAALRPDVIAFAIAAAVVAGFVSAFAPVWLAARADVESMLRESAGRMAGGRRRNRLQGALTAAQTAIAVTLLASSALLAGSVYRLLNQDVGFVPEAVTMNLTQRGVGADTDGFFTRLLERLRAAPGITAAGAVLMRPLQGTLGWDTTYALASESTMPGQERPTANFEVVTPGYFDALGTPLLRGRDFNDRDDRDAPLVVIVNRSLADRLQRQGIAPLGAAVKVRTSDAPATIVGIVADARYRGVRAKHDDVYVPYLQTSIPVRHLVLRGDRSPAELVSLVREETSRLDSAQPPAQAETISEAIRRDTAADRFNMILVLTFGLSALLLAAAGVYSVVSESVADRRRETAIRSALGASQIVLTRGLASAVLRFVLIGELAGLVVLAGASPLLSAQLYETDPANPTILAGVAVLILASAIAAAVLPAWAAAGKDPAVILQKA
jgi:predicted permease